MKKFHGIVLLPVNITVEIEAEGNSEQELIEHALEQVHDWELQDIERAMISWGYDPEGAEISTDPRDHNLTS